MIYCTECGGVPSVSDATRHGDTIEEQYECACGATGTYREDLTSSLGPTTTGALEVTDPITDYL